MLGSNYGVRTLFAEDIHSPERSCLPTKMKLGGRVNEASAKKLLAKQLGDFAANLDSIGFLDVKTGRISGKSLVCIALPMLASKPISQLNTCPL